MKVLVLCATSGVGREVVRKAVECGITVRAVSRRGIIIEEGIDLRRLAVDDPEVLDRLTEGTNAVLWCCEMPDDSREDPSSPTQSSMMRLGRSTPLARVITLSTGRQHAGVTLGSRRLSLPGALPRRGLSRSRSTIEETSTPAALGEHWTELHASALIDGPEDGLWRLTGTAPNAWAPPVVRGNVAAAMLSLVLEGGWEGQRPFITGRTR